MDHIKYQQLTELSIHFNLYYGYYSNANICVFIILLNKHGYHNINVVKFSEFESQLSL